MPDLRIEATINGRKLCRAAKPYLRLLDFLRDDLGHTGTKEGCGAGECGTCSVFVDGVLLKSCLVPVAKAQGASIDTVEGLATRGELSVLQQAFHKMGATIRACPITEYVEYGRRAPDNPEFAPSNVHAITHVSDLMLNTAAT